MRIEVGDRSKSKLKQADERSSSTSGRRSSSLLSLLQYLWEQSSLNRWHRYWRRNWYIARGHLLATVARGQSAGRALSEAIYIIPAFDPNKTDILHAQWNLWKQPLVDSAITAETAKRNPAQGIYSITLGMILGRIKSIQKSDKGGYIIKLKDHAYPIYSKSDLMESLQNRFPALQRGHEDIEVVVLAMVMPHAKGYFSLVDLGAMQTSSKLIPVDSGYEAQVARALVDSDRTFTKPLRYGGDGVFPDFVLHDTPSNSTIMEIYGVVGSEQYDERKKEKQET